MSLARLHEIAPPPDEPVLARGDWAALERELGASLPPDYKDLIHSYGHGCFGDFLYISSPFATDNNSLLERAKVTLEQGRENIVADANPFAVFPDPGGQFPWAHTSNGDRIYWLTQGPVEQWKIVVWECRAPVHSVHSCRTTDFLARLLSGTLACPILGEASKDMIDPTFSQYRLNVRVSIYFTYVERPYQDRLQRVMVGLKAKGIRKGAFFRDGYYQCEFWLHEFGALARYSDNMSYGSSIELVVPPAAETQFSEAIRRIREELGAQIWDVHTSGRPETWDEFPRRPSKPSHDELDASRWTEDFWKH
jgi:hypothetical protein